MTIKTHERFGQVRTVEQDGSTWYVGRDVAKILGYAKPEGFIARHVAKDDKKRLPVRSLNSPHTPPTVIINRNGLTDMCHAATSVDADNILHWLLEDVKVEEKAEEKSPAPVPQLLEMPEFGQMRWFIIDGDIWFAATDVCKILGHTNTTMALATLDEDEKRSIVLPKDGVTNTLSSTEGIADATFGWIENRVNIVNEFGLYRLIMASRKPNAKKFQRKVYHEVLPAIRKTGSYSVKGEMSLFPDEEPIKEKKAVRRPLPEVAVVYIILLANGLVKIGYSSDFNRRLKEIRKETKLDIVDFFTTNFMSLDDARKLEATLKAKFFDHIVSGEFFSVDFQTVKAALVGESKVDKLLAIADRMEPCPEKQSLLLQAAHALQ